ncbi:hypothetical protein VE03_02613 [Pseudogymnoascus sp. 23342-1-I1]|nr:hypothetical protein VE03_02613 [Pseudogymnoascus sp. 23342-1-I1]
MAASNETHETIPASSSRPNDDSKEKRGLGAYIYNSWAVLDQPTIPNASKYDAQRITPVDLNPNCLSTAAARIKSLPLKSSNGSIGDEGTGKEKFDSISLFYLLHCVPGPCSAKAGIFENLKTYLTADGTLYGATILGQGGDVHFNWFASALMDLYNKKGVFGNSGDNEKVFIEALGRSFEKVESRVEGCVLLFKASKPII